MAKNPYKNSKRQVAVSKLVRQFNAKIGRLSRSNPELVNLLPERISKEKFLNESSERYQQLKKDYERFLKPGQERLMEVAPGVIKTAWEVQKVKTDLKRVNKKKKEKQKGISPFKGNLRSVKTENLNLYSTDLSDITEGMFHRFSKIFEKQLRSNYDEEMNKLYKENYLEAMKSWNGIEGYKELHNIVKNLPNELVGESVYFDDIININGFYSILTADQDLSNMLEYWTEINQAYINGANVEDIRKAFDDFTEDNDRWEYLRAKFPDEKDE